MRGLWCIVASTALALGCGPSAEPSEVDTQVSLGGETAGPSGGAGTWPSHLLTSESTGPALFLHPTPDSPAIGYVSGGVRLRVASSPQGERLPVWIDGPLKVRGWVPFDRLTARAQQRGRVEGAPVYLGPNDLLGVRGAVGAESMRVEVRPWLGRGAQPALGTFVGTFPAPMIGADEVDPNAAEGPTPGEARQLPAGQEVPVHESIGGAVIATLPALDPPLVVVVLRERDEWKGVRVGIGPYLVGYVNAPLEPTDRQPEGAAGVIGLAASNPGGVPARLEAEADRPLWRVPPGTQVKFDGVTIAEVQQEGWAREMNRYETGEVDVFVAVNDDVAIRGMVRADRLQAVAGQAAPAEQPPPPPAPPPPAQ